MTQLNTYLNHMLCGILLENNLHKLVFINRSFLELYTIQEPLTNLINQNSGNIFKKCSYLTTNPDHFLSTVKKISNQKMPVLNEKITLLNGQVIEFDFTPVDTDEGYQGNIWCFRKIHPKEQSEKCAAKEDLCQFILENCNEGIWEWNLKTNHVYCSEQWKEMFGYSEEEIEGANLIEKWFYKTHPDDVSKVRIDMEDYLNGKTPVYTNEHRILCKNGKYKWTSIKGKAMGWDKDGKPTRIAGILTDISVKKELEESLARALEKEKETNRLKSQFMSMAIHEFRTPLSTILVTADLLEAYWEKMPKPKIILKINRIKKNITFLIRVMEQVLNLSLIELGKMRFLPEDSNMNEFLISITNEKREDHCFAHQIELTLPNSLVYAKVDKQMLTEVIHNLISNGAKYSPKHSTINIGLQTNDSNIIIRVTDQGIGIPEEEAEKIFVPFYRCKNVDGIKGSGLGLSLSRQFVRKHGGDITFESIKNEGTTFFISLPK